MNYIIRNPRFTCLTFIGIFLSLLAPIMAETLQLPKDQPIYSLDLPEGWTQEMDKDGDFKCAPSDQSSGPYTMQIIAMPAIQTKTEMKEKLPPLAKSMGETTKQTEFEVGDLEDSKNGNEVPFTGLRADGKTPEGDSKVTVLQAFEPQPGKWYVILTVGTEAADTAHNDAYEAIYDSIQSIK